MNRCPGLLRALLAVLPLAAVGSVGADTDAGDGADIRIGNIASYTGSGQDYAAVARAEAAYFRMINDRGGIASRKIDFISLDDGGDSGRALRQAQRLVEQEQVLALFSTFGTDANLAIREYANAQRVPQLFVEASSAVFDDPAHFPWTMGFYPTYRTEGLAYAAYVGEHRPNARIAVLYEDSAAGVEFRQGLVDGLGARAATMIVQQASYHAGNADAGDAGAGLDALLEGFKRSRADVFMNLAWGHTASAAIRRSYDLDWHPLQFIPNASLSVAAFLEPAGLAKASGIISSARSKSWWRPNAGRDPEVREFLDWMARYNPGASLRDQLNVAGYERAQALVAVLRQCGGELTRARVMAQATSLDLSIGMLRPGIRLTTSRDDFQPIKQLFLIRFDGQEWQPLDSVVTAAAALNRP